MNEHAACAMLRDSSRQAHLRRSGSICGPTVIVSGNGLCDSGAVWSP
jgi:hypothetical protein